MSKREIAQAELARRELARRSLLDFTTYTFPQYQVALHNILLAQYLESVELYVASGGAEGIGRLMVFMPPRHGKSELVSVRFPTWFLGRNPDKRVILASVTASLATGFSRQGRNIIQDTPYQAVFGARSGQERPVMLSDDSRSAEAWDLAGHRGGLVAAGVGGSIIGRGAHLGIIDDPFKDRADAESQIVRERTDDWYKSTFYTRLEDSAAVVLMHQRWHADDQAGRLLRRMVSEDGADQWVVLNLPAIAEEWAGHVEAEEVLKACREGWWKSVDALRRQPGDALWPEKYPVAALEAIAANIGRYEFDALYQQRPWRREGTLIKAAKIRIIDGDQVPGEIRWVRYWDLAVGRSSRAHYVSGAKCGMDAQRRFYIGDIARIPAPWSAARPKMVDVMLADPMEVVQGIEVAGQQDGYYQEFRDDERLHERSIKPVGVRGDKEARAQLWATRIEDDRVFMVRGPWNEDFIAEAVAFPAGANDDMVDGVSGGWQMSPGYVTMADVGTAPDVKSVWDPFGEMEHGSQDRTDRRGGGSHRLH